MDRDLWWRLLEKTQFRRMDLVVGLDRYQPQRKTLQTGYHEEYRAYEQERGIDSATPAHVLTSRATRAAFRLAGIPKAARMPAGIDPAISLDFGHPLTRLKYQALVKRRRMPIE
jgi:hypothetical protein